MKPYLTEEDKYDYGIDKLDIMLMTKKHTSLGSCAFMGRKRVYRIKPTMKIERRSNAYCQGVYHLKYNVNRSVREMLRTENQSVWYTISRSVFSQNDNFIPSGIRHELVSKNVSISTYRVAGLKEVWKQIQIEMNYFAAQLSEVCETDITSSDIQIYLGYAEIDYDIVRPPGEALASIPAVYEQANLIAKIGTGYYENKIFFACNFHELLLNHSTTKKPALQIGALINDKHFTAELYIKEEGQFGCQNRFEYRFTKKALKALLKSGREIENFRSFRKAFSKLAKYTFEVASKMLNSEIEKIEKDFSLLEEVLKRIFRTTWYDLLPLIKEKEIIETGVECSRIPKTCKNLIPKLAKHKVVFKKVGRSQYKVRWTILHKAHKNYQKMKSLEAQKKHRKKILKSWSTVGLNLDENLPKKVH